MTATVGVAVEFMMKSLKSQLAEKVAQIKPTESVMVIEAAEETASIKSVDQPVAPILEVVPTFAISIEEAKQRVALLQEFVRNMMTAGVDYGMVPGCPKPTLLKPGAEKLCDIFGFAKSVEVTSRIEDWDKPFLQYEVKVALINKRTGIVEAEGIGSCNSREKKYAKQDAYTVANTLLKMAKKRALVDAVLSATRSSGLFTQDIEDIDISPAPRQPEPIPPVSADLLSQIYQAAKQQKIGTEQAKKLLIDRYGIQQSKDLNQYQAEDFLKLLLAYKK